MSKMKKYDAIICNPPYLKFQKFIRRHQVLPEIESSLGVKIARYSNISSIFLLKAIKYLRYNGTMAFIMPFEFFNTGYGKVVKKLLVADGLLKQIIVLSNEEEIFPDAMTTICILLCKGDKKIGPVKVTKIASIKEIEKIKYLQDYYQHQVSFKDIGFEQKWTPAINSLYSGYKLPKGLVKLATYGKFTRGIATGANKFFALTKSNIQSLNLPNRAYIKCITRSEQVRNFVLSNGSFKLLSKNDRPIYCFNAKDSSDQYVKKYIQWGEEQGYHLRYITKNRSPWYKLEHRLPSPIWASVFNRGGPKFVRNFTNCISFTCFHLFYPNRKGQKFINRLFLYFISDIGQNILQQSKRDYGRGLEKFEPSDLNECFVPGEKTLNLITEDRALSLINLISRENKKPDWSTLINRPSFI